MTIRSLTAALITGIPLLFLGPGVAQAHCQIPCGIYDDNARIVAMLEDAATVTKAVKLISELSGKTDPQSQNQIVRWVVNKEQHAQRIIETISDYFLTQRVKPSQEDYATRLRLHHAVILAAVRAKMRGDDLEVGDQDCLSHQRRSRPITRRTSTDSSRLGSKMPCLGKVESKRNVRQVKVGGASRNRGASCGCWRHNLEGANMLVLRTTGGTGFVTISTGLTMTA